MLPKPDADVVAVPLNAEELVVERRSVDGDTVRVRTVVSTHDAIIDEALNDEHVEIERVIVRRLVEVPPPIRQEGDTLIVPVTEEVLVTERRLFLKEEVHIRRIRTTRRHQEVVTLREENAVIARTAPGNPSETTEQTNET